MVTVDADTLPASQALTYLIARVTSRPQDQHVCACAGALVVENATGNLLTRMQGWDYRLGINGVKRMQAAYNSALVAQGAFSAYWTEDLRAVGGWPDAIGEDIVLTWTLMDVARDRAIRAVRAQLHRRARAASSTSCASARAGRAACSRACARTPASASRACWPSSSPASTTSCPLLDFGYIFFWIPGVILFIAGYPLMFSWWSMLVIPITLIIFGLLRRWQERHVFRRLGVHPKQDIPRLLQLPVRLPGARPRPPPCAATCSTSPEPHAAGSNYAPELERSQTPTLNRKGPSISK